MKKAWKQSRNARKNVLNAKICGWFFIIIACLILLPAGVYAEVMKSERSGGQLEVKFQYFLANFSGPIGSQLAKLDLNLVRKEIYTLDRGLELRIFNPQGMEIFSLGSESALGYVVDMAVGPRQGEIFLLPPPHLSDGIKVLNYRGELESVIRLQGLPEELRDFRPDPRSNSARGNFFPPGRGKTAGGRCPKPPGKIYPGPRSWRGPGPSRRGAGPRKGQNVVVQHQRLQRRRGWQCLPRLVSTLFRVPPATPDGRLEVFGRSGSGPGRFGVVSGIASDRQGTIYVSATSCARWLMLFSPTFEFLGAIRLPRRPPRGH